MRVRTGLTAGETLTVYGSNTCGWTRKQLEYLDGKGLPYNYVDCDTQDCPDFVEAFPTIKKGGQVFVGFTEF
jgi:glutaredoxin